VAAQDLFDDLAWGKHFGCSPNGATHAIFRSGAG
jgi:hypothetical protein